MQKKVDKIEDKTLRIYANNGNEFITINPFATNSISISYSLNPYSQKNNHLGADFKIHINVNRQKTLLCTCKEYDVLNTNVDFLSLKITYKNKCFDFKTFDWTLVETENNLMHEKILVILKFILKFTQFNILKKEENIKKLIFNHFK